MTNIIHLTPSHSAISSQSQSFNLSKYFEHVREQSLADLMEVISPPQPESKALKQEYIIQSVKQEHPFMKTEDMGCIQRNVKVEKLEYNDTIEPSFFHTEDTGGLEKKVSLEKFLSTISTNIGDSNVFSIRNSMISNEKNTSSIDKLSEDINKLPQNDLLAQVFQKHKLIEESQPYNLFNCFQQMREQALAELKAVIAIPRCEPEPEPEELEAEILSQKCVEEDNDKSEPEAEILLQKRAREETNIEIYESVQKKVKVEEAMQVEKENNTEINSSSVVSLQNNENSVTDKKKVLNKNKDLTKKKIVRRTEVKREGVKIGRVMYDFDKKEVMWNVIKHVENRQEILSLTREEMLKKFPITLLNFYESHLQFSSVPDFKLENFRRPEY